MRSRSSTAADEPRPPRLIALVHDPRTGRHHRLVEFTTLGDEVKQCLIRSETVAEGERAVFARLATEDYPVPIAPAKRRQLLCAIEGQRVSRRRTLVDQVGWTGKSFVLPDETIGGSQEGEPPLHVELRDGHLGAKFSCAGSSETYWDAMVPLATGNHVLVFVLGLAFASPLLGPLKEELGGFQLVAGTRSGKSTSLEVAGSVWGGARYGETWRTTTNAVERTATDHNDLLLVLDEVALLGKDARSRANELYETVHLLVAGREKERLPNAEPRRRWRVLFLSASELTLRELLRRGNREVVGGELMRCLDIELPQTEAEGIFQDLHGAPSCRAFCAKLKQVAADCHGSIGRDYLQRLVRDLQTDERWLVAWLRDQMSDYRRRACPAGRGGEAESVAARFALVYAALRLAARYEVLPWSRRESYAAVRHCHRHARTKPGTAVVAATPADSRAGEVPDRPELVAAARKRIARCRHGLLSADREASPSAVERAPGFVHIGRNGVELLFTPAKFREVVCAGGNDEPMLAALKASGLLVEHNAGKSTIQRELPAPLGRRRVVGVRVEIERTSLPAGSLGTTTAPLGRPSRQRKIAADGGNLRTVAVDRRERPDVDRSTPGRKRTPLMVAGKARTRQRPPRA